jgi:hypothetical protein
VNQSFDQFNLHQRPKDLAIELFSSTIFDKALPTWVSFYAVACGWDRGIYKTWYAFFFFSHCDFTELDTWRPDCRGFVEGFGVKAKYKRLNTLVEAVLFIILRGDHSAFLELVNEDPISKPTTPVSPKARPPIKCEVMTRWFQFLIDLVSRLYRNS